MARVISRVLVLASFLFLASAHFSSTGVVAQENPQGEVNLNKNTAYNNAVKCFQNATAVCQTLGFSLNETGKLNINSTIQKQYCEGGCANQTLVELKCVSNVYAEFRFNNAATVSDVQNAIQTGCSTGNFTVIPSPSGANPLKIFGGSFWIILLATFLHLTYVSS
ncbi:hypothetical protein KP509_36G001200 [Ceratopteris richardii]|uniref:DUF7731 domain-containing protein n=1 Tax=Ceratopteris richardii TaxID=49495 RepID=A0A8T2QA71_CERRI|nr:hypothetical protein KP509_36G001200 [Ceratopteris richardii]